jgi:uncharacterized protein
MSDKLIEVVIDSVRASLMSPHRVVMLKDAQNDRYLLVWIGSCESDAITAELQGQTMPRPMTHDLLRNMIEALNASVQHILINDLQDEVYFARVVLNANGRTLEVDARPSDAIALAVRVKVPVYVTESIMDRASITPEQEVETEAVLPPSTPEVGEDKLGLFRDFVDSLKFDEDDDKKE